MPADLKAFPPQVPILGQPMTVLSTTLLPLVACHCAKGGSLVLIAQMGPRGFGSAPAACPSCGRTFLLRGVSVGAGGMLEYQLEYSDAADRGKAS